MSFPIMASPNDDAQTTTEVDPMAEPTTHMLDVPGAVLTYDVRPNHGQTGNPDGLAATLRGVLSAEA
jgi:hypothetical protein